MKYILYILFFFLSLLWSGAGSELFAQINYPLNREFGLDYEKTKNTITTGKKDSTSVNKDDAKNQEEASCFKPYIVPLSHQEKDRSRSLLNRKLTKESLFIVNDTSEKFYLTLDPLFNFQLGKDFADKGGEKLYTNTRGFLIRGDIGKKFSFESSFYENQSTFPQYINNYIANTSTLFPQSAEIVPGQGMPKPFKVTGYDYSMASGYISYSPSKYVNIQVGQGKHFVGDGYRSLLLSDNAYNYPYARITTTYKNFQYTNLYTSFMNITNGGVQAPQYVAELFQKKVGSFQMLNVNLFKRLQLGLFQGMIWQAADSTNRQHLNFNTFDPLIGANAAAYGFHSQNNILVGSTFKLKITNSFSFYGQYALNDLSSKSSGSYVKNKYGYQIGVKYYDLFTIKNLHLQVEYNAVSPYMYASQNPDQSYTHYNQPLADPLGANFKELIGFINYRLNKFFIQVQSNYSVKGVDNASFNYGGNIFRADNTFLPVNQSTITTTQGVKNTTLYEDIHIGYLVNKATNFNIVFGVTNRVLIAAGSANNNTEFVYFGVRTSLTNIYYDF